MNNNIFNKNIYKLVDIAQPNQDGNTIISGVSIKIALAMLLNGAQNESYDELIAFLGKSKELINGETLELLTKINDGIKFANVYWFNVPNTINEDYKKVIEEYQKAEIRVDDFNSPDIVQKINNWVSNKTNNLINKVIDSLEGSNSLLINTLYFNAQWESPFNENATQKQIFHGTKKESSVEMMEKYTESYVENEYAKGFKMLYKDLPYEFIALLPNKEADFNIEDLDIDNLDIKEGKYIVDAFLPKLNISYETLLKDVLPKLGVIAPFENDSDFLNMLSRPQRVFQIIHKNSFKLDEKGTQAAASTVIEMRLASALRNTEEPIRIKLEFNRPFAFVIRHKVTKDLLFVGKINNL